MRYINPRLTLTLPLTYYNICTGVAVSKGGNGSVEFVGWCIMGLVIENETRNCKRERLAMHRNCHIF